MSRPRFNFQNAFYAVIAAKGVFMHITPFSGGIYRIEVPFDDIYTAVFAVGTPDRYLLIDCATTAEDVDRVILQALQSIDFDRAPEALLLTHRHGDHAGGADRLRMHFPDLSIYSPEPLKTAKATILTGGETFLERMEAVSLPGHTANSMGYLDHHTQTLFSGDTLQLFGVSRYRNGIGFPKLYRASIEAVRALPINRIIASHEYDPLGACAEGRDAINRYLDICLAACPQE